MKYFNDSQYSDEIRFLLSNDIKKGSNFSSVNFTFLKYIKVAGNFALHISLMILSE